MLEILAAELFLFRICQIKEHHSSIWYTFLEKLWPIQMGLKVVFTWLDNINLETMVEKCLGRTNKSFSDPINHVKEPSAPMYHG